MRKLLDKIIHTDGGDNWWKPKLFELKTLNKLPKELEIIKTPPSEHKNYNCFIYALGLDTDKKIIRECGGFIYDTFFQKLINENLLEYTDNPKVGDYILYSDLKKTPNAITHVGIIGKNNLVISKWAWGPLFKHKIFDTPESYDNDISYVKAVSKERAKELYETYKDFNIKS